MEKYNQAKLECISDMFLNWDIKLLQFLGLHCACNNKNIRKYSEGCNMKPKWIQDMLSDNMWYVTSHIESKTPDTRQQYCEIVKHISQNHEISI